MMMMMMCILNGSKGVVCRKTCNSLVRRHIVWFFTARCYASAVLAMGLCLSVCLCPCLCLSQVGVLLKRLKRGSQEQHHTIAQGL